MNNDLISKSALVDKLQALEEGIFEEATQEMNPTKAIMAGIVEGAKKLVADAPTIDAAPVVHAEWDHWGGDEWQCTNCAAFIHTEGSWEKPWQKYCPYCGAKMDGGDPA